MIVRRFCAVRGCRNPFQHTGERAAFLSSIISEANLTSKQINVPFFYGDQSCSRKRTTFCNGLHCSRSIIQPSKGGWHCLPVLSLKDAITPKHAVVMRTSYRIFWGWWWCRKSPSVTGVHGNACHLKLTTHLLSNSHMHIFLSQKDVVALRCSPRIFWSFWK